MCKKQRNRSRVLAVRGHQRPEGQPSEYLRYSLSSFSHWSIIAHASSPAACHAANSSRNSGVIAASGTTISTSVPSGNWLSQPDLVYQGKGSADRHVQLPRQYRDVLQQLGSNKGGDEFIFPGESNSRGRSGRHISSRTVQRVVRNACLIAGVKKHATPHSFRHAFATHSFEDGCDIRRIQAVLGHARLETTTIYVKVAQQRTEFPSPLDRLPQSETSATGRTSPRSRRSTATPSPQPVGSFRLHARRHPQVTDRDYQQTKLTQLTIEITGRQHRAFLLGTVAEIARPGFVTIKLPAAESWSSTIASLPRPMQQRINQPEFYEALQAAISAKMIAIEHSIGHQQ